MYSDDDDLHITISQHDFDRPVGRCTITLNNFFPRARLLKLTHELLGALLDFAFYYNEIIHTFLAAVVGAAE